MTKPITYLPVKFEELEQVAALMSDSFGDFFNKINFSIPKNQLIDVLQLYLVADNEGFIVAKEGDKVVGFIISITSMNKLWKTLLLKFPHELMTFIFSKRAPLITLPYFNLWDKGHIFSEAVHKDYRNKGIANKLGDEAIKHLTACGVKQILFDCLGDNEEIIRIYEKKSFKKLKEFKSRGNKWILVSRFLDSVV